MNKLNLLHDEHSQVEVESFIEDLLKRYVSQQEIFFPLSTLLPNHWNSIFYTAVKHLMFKKAIAHFPNGTQKSMWLTSIDTQYITDNYVNIPKLAKAIIEYTKDLRKFIWKKNGWGNPYPLPQKTLPLHNEEKKSTETVNEFISRCKRLINSYMDNDSLKEELLRQIYNYGMNMYGYGYVDGMNATDNIIDTIIKEESLFRKKIKKLKKNKSNRN